MQSICLKSTALIAYDEALAAMMELHAGRVAGQIEDTIWVLQHEPVITKGRRLHEVHVPLHPALQARGITIRPADRGGELTYHGPGQIVVYFVLRVQDYFAGVSEMVQSLEEVLINFLADYGIAAHLRTGHPGIWVGPHKLASVGLRVSQGVTRHGIALNINNDLDVYRYFSPCGLAGDCMTHVQHLLARRVDTPELLTMMHALAAAFKDRLMRQNRSPQS